SNASQRSARLRFRSAMMTHALVPGSPEDGIAADRLGARSRPFWLSFDRMITSAAMIFSFFLILAPLAFLFYGSFRTGSPGDPKAVFTLANWLEAYGRPLIHTALLNTVLLSGMVALVSILLGFIMAWIVARTNAPGRERLAILLVIPLMI